MWQQFLLNLWSTVQAALRLDSAGLARVAADPAATWYVATIVAAAGASLLLGQSAVLLANQVTPGRFVLSLGLNAVLYGLGLVFWAGSIWLIARTLFGATPTLGAAMWAVGMGSAPLLFGFLVLLPYLGTPLEWALRIWALLITVVTVRSTFPLTLAQSLVCVALGWLALELLGRTVGRPLMALRNWIWHTVTGAPFDTNTRELVEVVVGQLGEQLAAHGSQQDTARAP